MDLPPELRRALEEVLEGRSLRDLAVTTRLLSQRYRATVASARRGVRGEADVLAYLAYRMPATFAAMHAAFSAARNSLPDWSPRTMVDVGAGPGTASWAATSVWPDIEEIRLLEPDQYMRGVGETLASAASHPAVREGHWCPSGFGAIDDVAPSDLVVAGYVLNEMGEVQRRRALHALWKSTAGVLAIVEPGTPAGFEIVREARVWLLGAGAQIVAPCPHPGTCPMAGGDWCHFAARVSRSRTSRSAKAATLAYEDEKYSYVTVSRGDAGPVESRIIRHPQVRSAHIHLDLCTRYGLRHTVVPKSDRAQFRRAREARWGSDFPYDTRDETR